MLLGRSAIELRRNKMIYVARIAQNLFVGLLALAIFFDLETGTATGNSNFAGAMLFSTVFPYVQCIFATLLLFHMQLDAFLREQVNKLYSPLSFFLAKTLVEIPVDLFSAAFFPLIFFFGVGFTVSAANFFKLAGVLALEGQAAVSMGTMIGCAF